MIPETSDHLADRWVDELLSLPPATLADNGFSAQVAMRVQQAERRRRLVIPFFVCLGSIVSAFFLAQTLPDFVPETILLALMNSKNWLLAALLPAGVFIYTLWMTMVEDR